VVGLPLRADHEARGLLVVERAETFEVPAGFLELDGLADQSDDINPGLYFVNVIHR
jgi:hypothetical protein